MNTDGNWLSAGMGLIAPGPPGELSPNEPSPGELSLVQERNRDREPLPMAPTNVLATNATPKMPITLNIRFASRESRESIIRRRLSSLRFS